MRVSTKHRGRHGIGLTSLAGSAALVAVGALTVALLAGASGAATNVAPTNTGEPSITGTPRVGQVLRTTRGAWAGTDSDPVPVPLVPVRRSGQAGRVGLHADHERQERSLRPSRGRCRLPDPFAGHGDERRRLGHGNVEPDGRRYGRQAVQHDRAVDLGHGGRRQRPQGEPRPVGRRRSDHLLVRLAAL